MSVAYIGPKSRTKMPRKTKIGTKVAHVTCDSDTTYKDKRSKVNLAYCDGLPHSLLEIGKNPKFCVHVQFWFFIDGIGNMIPWWASVTDKIFSLVLQRD